MPVKWQPDFEPQGVARTQSGRHGAAREQAMPEPSGGIHRGIQFEAYFPCIPRTADHDRVVLDVRMHKVEVFQSLQRRVQQTGQHRGCTGPLKIQFSGVVRKVVDVRVCTQMLTNPRQIARLRPGVDHHHEFRIPFTVQNHIINHAARRIAHQAVAALPGR